MSASQVYDKVRFRIVTRSVEDVFPVLNYVQRSLVPFNFVIPGQSTNTLVRFHNYCQSEPALARFVADLQLPLDLEDGLSAIDNRFTAPSYRVVHFIADVPVRVPAQVLAEAPRQTSDLGHTIFVQTEFQVIDRRTDEKQRIGGREPPRLQRAAEARCDATDSRSAASPRAELSKRRAAGAKEKGWMPLAPTLRLIRAQDARALDRSLVGRCDREGERTRTLDGLESATIAFTRG